MLMPTYIKSEVQTIRIYVCLFNYCLHVFKLVKNIINVQLFESMYFKALCVFNCTSTSVSGT